MIDSHQHFWYYNEEEFGWLTDEMAFLRQDFLPEHLLPELEKNGITGTVPVQAPQTEKETRFLLDIAHQYEFVKGVVGWLDLRANDIEEKIQHYSKDPYLKGIRHIVEAEPDDRFLLRKDFMNGISKLARHDLTYDILIHPKHLPATLEFVEKFPDQKFVIDHIAKPDIKNGNLEYWAYYMKEISKKQNVWVKVSGMVTEADWNNYQFNDFVPYLDIIFEYFDVNKIMYGSDWPVCRLAAKYAEVMDILKIYANKHLSISEQNKIFYDNASSFYNLKN